MSVFVKKLVDMASLKKHPGFSDSLRPDDVNPRLVFHHGISSGSVLLAYDSIQQILAISTKDGQIKLFGKDGSQALLESSETIPSKFLLFVENQGILISANVNNQIEVWDLGKKSLSAIHHFEKEISSFVAMRNGAYMYIGDSSGNVSILRLHENPCHIEPMKYHIPLSASYGKINEVGSDIAAKHVLPQPTAENKRALIIYSDGVITLWGIRESKVVFTNSGGTTMFQEAKKVTAACWACSLGTKVAVGYSNGDIILWSVPCPADSNAEQAASQITQICKLNLGYKAEKIPIAKLKWADADGKSSRLYVLGSSDCNSTNLLQVVLLNEHTETRTIKLGLHPREPVVDLEITTSSIDQNKHRRDSLLLLGKSSHIYTYDDSLIERYLVQSQNKSSPSLPKEVMVKLPYVDSSITVTKFITSIPCMPSSSDEDFNMLVKNSLPLFPFERSIKDGSNSNSTTLTPFSKAKNLLITGHSSGAINFWDASCPLLLPVASITQQSDSDFSLSGIPLTALHFSYDSHILVSGDQSGTVRIFTFKSETFAPQSTFMSFQGSSKKGSSNIIRRIKVVKVNGAVLSITATENLKHLAIGSDQGYVSLIDPDGPSVLYERHIASEFCTGNISIHFETCSFHGFEKNVILVTTKDSSVFTLERDTGSALSSGVVRPNKPAKALFTRVLDYSYKGSSMPDAIDVNSISSDNSTLKQSFMLLCTEKSVYAFSLSHLVQGVKKVIYKKKFSSPCYWASTFGSPDVGLILLFASGKIEIRSLPELSLVKESSIRALTFSTIRPFSVSDIIVSSSLDGELIIVNGNQEFLFVSTLLQETYRFLDFVSMVLNKDLVNAQGVVCSPPIKEKKKGIFASVIKDNKSAKLKNGHEVETEDCRRSIEELSTIFSTVNFVTDTESEERNTMNEENADLDIDDIEIEDPKEKPRGYPVIAGLNRQNITNKFQAIRGKLKHTKVKSEKVTVNEEPQDEKPGAIDQIKKKYGYASSVDSGAANMAKTKLSENLKKLQGISLKTSEMQDTARSFSSMAKDKRTLTLISEVSTPSTTPYWILSSAAAMYGHRGALFGSGGVSDGYEIGSKRPRMMESTPYFAVRSSSSSSYQTHGYDSRYQPSSFPVVRLRGLPFNCADVDIFKFFGGLDIVDVFLVNKDGRFSGEAFVLFAGPMQADLALRRDRQNMGRRYVEVFRCKKQDYYHAVATEVKEASYGSIDHRGSPPPVRRKRSSPEKDRMEYTEILKMRGLPYSVRKSEILKFFQDLIDVREDKIHIACRSDGKATGEAYVEFGSAEDAKKAMSKDKMLIGSRYVELFPSTPDEFRRAASRSR
ncbi:hypothetical protein C2S51_000184 [Perilla frutescens var. frutescens]|nr:hypothetical protein C2S51_000184 [Perilla frutescens var. frutescens]